MNTSRQSQSSSSAKDLELFLVYGSLRIGGIETLIVRMANFFVSRGVRVSIYCAEGGELQSLLDDRVSFIERRKTSDLIKAASAYVSRESAKANIVMISFDPISAARALMIEAGLPTKTNVVHVSGIYHPRAYFMEGERADRIFLNSLVASAVGNDRLFFMNEECRKAHAMRWKADLSSSRILALPVNQAEMHWQASDHSEVRVISVGRLVPFKTYNLGAAKIARACVDHGIEIEWDIFGDGPLQGVIKAEIEAHGMSKHVRLMGALDYRDYSERVAKYDLFVGMGTAALEAAMIGVPTICATVDQATRCYGYLQDLPFGNVGELQESSPTVELSDLIGRYSKAERSHRAYLSNQSRLMAEMYGMPKFFEEIINMVSIKTPAPSRVFKRMIAELYYLATESFLVNAIRYCISGFRRA